MTVVCEEFYDTLDKVYTDGTHRVQVNADAAKGDSGGPIYKEDAENDNHIELLSIVQQGAIDSTGPNTYAGCRGNAIGYIQQYYPIQLAYLVINKSKI